MSATTQQNDQSEWLKVLGKGMITIPINWRKALNFKQGDILKASKRGNQVIIEAPTQKSVPYRLYSDAEINSFIKDDSLS